MKRLVGLAALAGLLIAAAPTSFRYGHDFAVALKKENLELETLKKKLILVERKEGMEDLPALDPKDLHFKNLSALHRFVYTDGQKLLIDRQSSTDPRALNFILISLGERPLAAGLIGRSTNNQGLSTILLTNRSKRFCTTYAQLEDVKKYLVGLGFPEAGIILQRNKPMSCESVLTRQQKMIRRFEETNQKDEP